MKALCLFAKQVSDDHSLHTWLWGLPVPMSCVCVMPVCVAGWLCVLAWFGWLIGWLIGRQVVVADFVSLELHLQTSLLFS